MVWWPRGEFLGCLVQLWEISRILAFPESPLSVGAFQCFFSFQMLAFVTHAAMWVLETSERVPSFGWNQAQTSKSNKQRRGEGMRERSRLIDKCRQQSSTNHFSIANQAKNHVSDKQDFYHLNTRIKIKSVDCKGTSLYSVGWRYTSIFSVFLLL